MSLNPRRALDTGASITQMGREFGVTARALRYYEQLGLLSPGRRREARVYSYRDRVRLKLVLKGRRAGFTLTEVRDLLEVYDKQGLEAQQAMALPRFKARLEALEQDRAHLTDTIDRLKDAASRMETLLGDDLDD
ncbi:MAG TPA: MerR family transcriptional regulator [Caulobacteraceae bacterium]|jgi:DNA-binding transcriptional MerR regulator